MDPSARAKHLVEDGASMMWVLEMAHVLAQGESVLEAELKKARDAHKVIEDKLFRVEIALGHSKDKLKKKTVELEKKTKDWENEKEKLVEDLKAKWKATEDDHEDLKSLETRAQLVESIEALWLDCLDIGKVGFSIAMDKLRILIPGLNTVGASLRGNIVDRWRIPREPEEDEKEEEEEE